MIISKNFLNKISPLYSADTGTELISTLLYSLIRMTRPKTVLEIGSGYTTAFILSALSENFSDYWNEMKLIDNHIDQLQRVPPNMVSDYYLETSKKPLLYTIDNLSSSVSKASQVSGVIQELGLEAFSKVINKNFTDCANDFSQNNSLFDFAWFDCGGHKEYVDFLDNYWKLINPDGGMLLLHSTLTNSAIHEVIVQLKQRLLASDNKDFELLSLLEPHKRMQNSVTMIRMISQTKIKIYSAHP